MAPESNENSQRFQDALRNRDSTVLAHIPKSDLHVHIGLGGSPAHFEAWYGAPLPAHSGLSCIEDLDRYIHAVLVPYLRTHDPARGLRRCLESTFVRTREEGITLLQASVDISFLPLFGGAAALARTLEELRSTHSPSVRFIPQLGLARDFDDLGRAHALVEEGLSIGYFQSLDLYGVENSRPPHEFSKIFQMARAQGLRLCAHSGEFQGPEALREVLDVLGPSDIMHGIRAAESLPLLRQLAEDRIWLHVCPTSNLQLGRVSSLQTHPLRQLVDHGVRVTLNTDDCLLFRQSLIEEYLALLECGLLSAQELDGLRRSGLDWAGGVAE